MKQPEKWYGWNPSTVYLFILIALSWLCADGEQEPTGEVGAARDRSPGTPAQSAGGGGVRGRDSVLSGQTPPRSQGPALSLQPLPTGKHEHLANTFLQ